MRTVGLDAGQGQIETGSDGAEATGELIGGRRTTFDGQQGDMLRLNLQARYLFN